MIDEVGSAPAPIAPGGKGSPSRSSGGLGVLGGVVLLMVAAVLLVGVWAFSHVRNSVPALDGERTEAGISQPVTIERDALGVATIRGENRVDVAFGLGFAHGQDRFVQMDLTRRQGAGELSELVGAGALRLDRRNRAHRFRPRAERVFAALPPADRLLLTVYAEGVNAGLRSLRADPFEYLLLRADPAPWRPEDTLLVVYSMYFELNDERGRREATRGTIHDVLGPEMLEFLDPPGTEWDSPLEGGPFATGPVPGPEILDLRQPGTARAPRPARSPAATEAASGTAAVGSNNWAVTGRLTAHGGAMLAGDMHLGHSVPNIWYRASLVYPDPEDPLRERRVTGVSLPGAPLIVAGSNGRVAWAFTNAYGDWGDLVVLEEAPGDGDAYLTADGPQRFVRHQEVLLARGGESETLEVVETIWGPVIDTDIRGRRRALRWIAHDPGAVNLELLDVEEAGNVAAALEIANRIGAPPQNFVAADSAGSIGWTIMGRIPRRFGHNGRLPASWADGSRGWDGWLASEEYPRVVDPEDGRVWTANSRVVGGEMMRKIGLGTYRLGARSRQIRDALLAHERFAEADLLAIQLDDRALFLERWRRLLLETLTPEALAADSRRGELRRAVEEWGGRASIESVGYRMVRAWRLVVSERVFEGVTARCREADESFDHDLLQQLEGPLWRLVAERPEHLLEADYESWDELLLRAVDATLDHFVADGSPLSAHTWGARNTASIRHPLSAFLPGLGRWLDMPADQLPGDSNMPRVQTPNEGASQRMVVSPGREQDGIFHMPAGQSGHPLSPHYRDGHRAWVDGEATPFLPGPPLHALTLQPPA